MDEKTPADVTRADVERDGRAPWTDGKRLTDALDTDDMADTAAARPYERAAGYTALGAERYVRTAANRSGTTGDRRRELALAGLPGRDGPGGGR